MPKVFKKNPHFAVFSALAIMLILMAVCAPIIAPYDPSASSLADAALPPSGQHWFGTDKLGRDVFSRIIYGGRASLSAALVLVAVTSICGSLLGTISGYVGGAVDAVIMRLADMMISFPGMVLAIAVAGILGPSMQNAIIAIAVVSWTKYARISRSLVLKIKHSDYIEAAKIGGCSTPHIIVHYLIPNVFPTLLVTAATDIGTMMLELAALSFLGFGAQPPTSEWGLMLSEGRPDMLKAPWLMIFPGLAIFLAVVVFNLLGDSVRDVLDPRNE